MSDFNMNLLGVLGNIQDAITDCNNKEYSVEEYVSIPEEFCLRECPHHEQCKELNDEYNDFIKREVKRNE